MYDEIDAARMVAMAALNAMIRDEGMGTCLGETRMTAVDDRSTGKKKCLFKAKILGGHASIAGYCIIGNSRAQGRTLSFPAAGVRIAFAEVIYLDITHEADIPTDSLRYRHVVATKEGFDVSVAPNLPFIN